MIHCAKGCLFSELQLYTPVTGHAICHTPLQWCHNGHDGVSNHQRHYCMLNHLFTGRSKKTSKLRVTVTGEFPTQMVIWWRHHAQWASESMLSQKHSAKYMYMRLWILNKRQLAPDAKKYIKWHFVLTFNHVEITIFINHLSAMKITPASTWYVHGLPRVSLADNHCDGDILVRL